MSAFICPIELFNRLVSFIDKKEYLRYIARDLKKDNLTLDDVGQILLNENYKSVNYRYNEDKNAPKYKHKYVYYTIVQIIKDIHCLDYQACESDDYEKSQCKKILNFLIWNASSKIDGYDKAEWG